MSLRPRAALTGAVLLVGVVAVPIMGTGPAAAEGGRCERGTGVTVVVDYGPLGRGVEIGCDPDGADKPASQVVPAAGFPLTYVNGQGFVCRISGLPDESQEQCSRTPPEDAYWALYWSDGEPATWVYSSEGVGSLDVPEGGSIGWRFQDGGEREVPGAAPTTQKEPRPSQQPSSPPPPQPSSAPATPTPGPAATPGAGADSPGETPPGAETPDDGNARRDGGEPDEGARPGGQGRDERRDRTDRDRGRRAILVTSSPSPSPTVAAASSPVSGEPTEPEGSSTTLTLFAGTAVLLLAAAAGVIAWRRRG